MTDWILLVGPTCILILVSIGAFFLAKENRQLEEQNSSLRVRLLALAARENAKQREAEAESDEQ